MKKCPFCNADIEDSARFCLYCMTSFEEKQIIESPKENNKRWLIFIAAVLVFALIVLSIFLLAPKNKVDNNSSLPILQNDIILDKDSSDKIILSGETNSKNNNSKNNEQNNAATHESNGSSDNTNNHSGTDLKENSNNDGSSYSSSSSYSSQPSSTPSQEDDNDDESSTHQGSSETTPVKTEAVYIYRDAIAADCYTEGNIPAMYAPTQLIEDVIVITGVSVAASDGTYTIPETINGKKVGAVMQSAFCDSAISSTVKKVVIPSTVKTIWQNAFSSCYNLTDVYLQGKIINIFETAFADTSKRTGTLTIHCSRDCKTFGYYYYRNIVANYSAQYKEWNG